MSNHPIQELCKRLSVFVCASILIHCGSEGLTGSQGISFSDKRVVFQDGLCKNNVEIFNTSGELLNLSFVTAGFSDRAGHKDQKELDQKGVIKAFEPVTIASGGVSKGKLQFDLSKTKLQPPISVSVVIVGIAGDQVSDFVGNFTCQ